ncbi:MAG: MauE/DoxX family redox-associated membrane protein [Flavobacteriales bacterium]
MNLQPTIYFRSYKLILMQNIERYLPWSIRILIAGLFLVSAYGKIYPDPSAYGTISIFEVKQLYPLGFTTEIAKIFSRSLIGVEFGLGLLLLFPFDLKKYVIPSVILMLGVFVVHLTIQIATSGNQGNCGCFGALLPMTPLEAILKNVLSIGLLLILWKRYGAQLPEKSNLWFLTTILSMCMLLMFIFIPTYKAVSASPAPSGSTVSTTIGATIDTLSNKKNGSGTSVTTITTDPKDAKDTTKTTKPKDLGPKQKQSGYAKYFANIDQGKKLICFFAPSCDHCRATAKQLTSMKNSTPDFPELQILFMDEAAEEIPDFFKFAGAAYNYKVLDIIEFWGVLGGNRDVPGVAYLWNGNTVKFYHSPEGPQAFNKEDLKTQLQKQKLR